MRKLLVSSLVLASITSFAAHEQPETTYSPTKHHFSPGASGYSVETITIGTLSDKDVLLKKNSNQSAKMGVIAIAYPEHTQVNENVMVHAFHSYCLNNFTESFMRGSYKFILAAADNDKSDYKDINVAPRGYFCLSSENFLNAFPRSSGIFRILARTIGTGNGQTKQVDATETLTVSN